MKTRLKLILVGVIGLSIVFLIYMPKYFIGGMAITGLMWMWEVARGKEKKSKKGA